MKKVISLLLTVLLLVSSCIGVFASGDYYDVEAKLISMGILTQQNTPLDNITEMQFFDAVVRTYTAVGAEATQEEIFAMAQSLGLTAASSVDELSSSITFYSALRIMVDTLGYDKIMTNNDDVSYLIMAQSKGLLKGMEGMSNSVLKWYNAVFLFDNFANMVPITYANDSLLGMIHQIHKLRGVVTANERTAIIGNKAADGKAVIADITVNTGTSGVEDYIGKYVETLVRYDRASTEYTVLHVEEKNNETVVMADGDNITTDARTYISYLGEDEREDTYNLNPAFKVIYNDVLYNDYTVADFNPDCGSVTIVDNDGDALFDVVYIEKYDTILAGATSATNMTIANRYSYMGAVRMVDLSTEKNDNFKTLLNADGTKAKIEDIAINNVINVKIDKSDDVDVVTAIVSTKTAEGKVAGYSDEDDTITIGSTAYELTQELKDAIAANDSAAEKIKLGVACVAYLDSFDRVAAIIYEDTGSEYAWLLKMAVKDGMEEEVQIRYMTMSGEWLTASFAEKVLYNGVKTSDTDLYNALTANGTTQITPQVTAVKLNAKSEVSEFETAAVGKDDSYEYLKFHGQVTGQWNYSNRIRDGAGLNPSGIYLTDDAVMLFLPEVITTNEDDYSIGDTSVLKVHGDPYTFNVYNLDEYRFTDLVTVTMTDAFKTEKLNASDNFMVLKVFQTLRGDGTPMTAIRGRYGNYEDIWVGIADDAEIKQITLTGETIDITTADLHPGMILKMRTHNGEAVEVRVLVDLTVDLSEPQRSSGDLNSAYFYVAEILKLDVAGNKMFLAAHDTWQQALAGGTPFKLRSGIKYYEYNVNTFKVTPISAGDIAVGDKVAVYSYWSQVYEIYKLVD